MESDFDELMNTTVVISTSGPASRTVWGVESYSTSVTGNTYNARYVAKYEELRGPSGEVVVQTGVVWVGSTHNFSTKASVYVTSAARAYPIVGVEQFPDENGRHHAKLRLGHHGGSRA